MRARIREHLHFLIVTTVLTVVMTFPTFVYVFKTDEFWLPEKNNRDVFIELWNIWYGRQVITGQADRFFTDLIFYPEGVSLAYHPHFSPHIIVVNALQFVMPLSNAYSLTFLLIIFSSALAAYLYLLWLFKHKWLALFGAVLFGFSPQVIGYPGWPSLAWIAPMPVIIYCLHRGINEKRTSLIILAGLFAGLTTTVVMYFFVCVMITLGLFISGLAASRWRDRIFWRHVVLLIAVLVLASAWRVIPMLQEQEALDRATAYARDTESRSDLISFFVNSKNPILGPLADSIFEIPDRNFIGKKSYLGLLPLALLVCALVISGARRKALPWLGILLVFLVMSLGSTLSINGTVFESIKLPKHYLNQLFPFVFAAFNRLNFFMAGVWLPLAVLACLGLISLRERLPVVARPGFILVLIAIVAFEYYSPIDESVEPIWSTDVSEERLAYLDWLAQQEENEIALVNVPFGWLPARFYSLAQSLSGYPITEGAISRTPSKAYDYINANFVLNAWRDHDVIHCDTTDERDAYLAALAALEADGFSHVVFHRGMYGAANIAESFDGVPASYSDGFVSIYRLNDLRDSCPAELSARHFFASAYADALGKGASLDERHGVAVILPPTSQIADHFLRYLRHAGQRDKTVAAVSSDGQGKIEVRSTVSIDLEKNNAVWLVKDRLAFKPEPTETNYAWLLARFKFCQVFYQDEHTTIDLYLKLDIPCAAMDESSALEVRYDEGVRLHNASFEADSDEIRFYLAWTNDAENQYAFSIQFFGEDGRKALQYDNLILRELLAVHELDITPLSAGTYTAKLIVYDFETQISEGGIVIGRSERFERELEIARIEV